MNTQKATAEKKIMKTKLIFDGRYDMTFGAWGVNEFSSGCAPNGFNSAGDEVEVMIRNCSVMRITKEFSEEVREASKISLDEIRKVMHKHMHINDRRHMTEDEQHRLACR